MEELHRKNPEQYAKSDKLPVLIVLDNIRSMNNVGSIFRTADAFLIEGIYLCGITAQPPHREIHKTALGATHNVAWTYYPNTMESILDLKQSGYTVFGIEQVENSIKLEKFTPPEGKTALVFGNEVKGIEQEVLNACDGCIEISQFGTKHSLNIAVTVGIVLWSIACQYNQKIQSI